MSVYKATSWGRTRSPKNLAGSPGTEVVCLANTNDLRLSNAGYKTVGYATENQRYLHLLLEDATTSDDPGAVTVFGYCHAFERWFEIPESFSPIGTNTAPTAVSLDLGNSSNDENAKVPSDREYRTYEILGIDRVAFVCATAAAQINVWAACSTF